MKRPILKKNHKKQPPIKPIKHVRLVKSDKPAMTRQEAKELVDAAENDLR